MSINAYTIVPFTPPENISTCTPSINAHLLDQGRQAASQAGIAICTNAPYKNHDITETDGFRIFNKYYPEFNIPTVLQQLGMPLTPKVTTRRDGVPIALLANDGRAYTTQNNTPTEQNDLRKLGTDQTLRQRAACYAQDHGLTDHGMDLPPVSEAYRDLLHSKRGENSEIYQLTRKGDLELLNNSDTITVINASRSEINPWSWSAEANIGSIFPGSEKLLADLNAGTITNFTTRVAPAPDGDGRKLLVEISLTVEGETFTYSQLRTKTEYLSGASLAIPFGAYGTMVYSSPELEIKPNRGSYPVRFKGDAWRVTLVQGGIQYVSISANGQHLGIMKLPELRTAGKAEKVVIGLDAGETSVVTYLKVDQDKPRPVKLSALEDVFPLIQASSYDTKIIAENQWFPLAFDGMARSKSQKFAGNDQSLVSPLPYVYARPCINQSNGFQLLGSIENRVFSGFKSQLVIRNTADKEKQDAYLGSIASFTLLALTDALRYAPNEVHLHVAYPNNKAFRAKYEQNIIDALNLLGSVLIDAKGRPFHFSKPKWYTEGCCAAVCIEVSGINDVIGSMYMRYIGSDMGGSTTDVVIRINRKGDKVMLPAIPIAGRTVTLGSMAQLARVLVGDGRRCGLHLALRETDPDMTTVLNTQVLDVVRRELKQGGNLVDILIGLAENQELQEGIQTIIDYFPLELDDNAGVLLKSLICAKDLLIQDIIMRQSSPLFDPEDRDSTVHLLRLGNGSKCVQLIASRDNHYRNTHEAMANVLQKRMECYLEGTAFRVSFNRTPKTEVALGLTTAQKEDADLQDLQCEGVQTLAELQENYLEEAADVVMDQVQFLRESVPEICGAISPYQTDIERGFPQLLEQLESREQCIGALLNTLKNEKGRFGSIYQASAHMGVSVWAAYAIMDAMDRALAIIQAAAMKAEVKR